MKRIQNTLALQGRPTITNTTFTETTALFDIETTGFSPKHTNLYLIGLAWREGENVQIEQLLADDVLEEKALLDAFLDRLTAIDTLLTYNGSGFDLPYLKEKLRQQNLPDPFDRFAYIDLYQELSGLKGVLGLPNLKQKSVETFLSIERKDEYSGGDLIPVYRHYSATKDSLPEELLLLHNFEDVRGMLDLIPMRAYPSLFNGDFIVTDASIQGDELHLMLTLTTPLPRPLTLTALPYRLRAEGDSAKLSVQIEETELKYFFPEPKDYYYLPEEDLAIHKSVSSYVEKSHRKQATKATCYTRKAGRFLPQPIELFTPVFRKGYKEHAQFFLVPEKLEASAFQSYATSVLDWVKHSIQYVP